MQVKRNELTKQEKYLGFKKAFQTINAHKSSGNYIGAYVVAFSLFEDRVTASYMLARDLVGKDRPLRFANLKTKINFLHNNGHLTGEARDRWQKAADARNRLLHEAMWHPYIFTDSDCKNAVANAREADKLASRLNGKK